MSPATPKSQLLRDWKFRERYVEAAELNRRAAELLARLAPGFLRVHQGVLPPEILDYWNELVPTLSSNVYRAFDRRLTSLPELIDFLEACLKELPYGLKPQISPVPPAPDLDGDTT